VRRGDALGLRALADQFADAVAPGLSNRVRDGRWVTILSWCLARSQEAFHASRGRSVQTRAEQRERYAWLRPLELMWVARTIALAEDWKDRSLAGQRRVRPWHAIRREDARRTPDRFGMSPVQFLAYRQTGMYGGYRRVFRRWPDMTVLGDGWTPGPVVNRLADWLDGKLGSARPSWPLHQADDHEESPLKRMPKLGAGDKHDWWLRHWTTFDHGGRAAEENTLPRPKTEFRVLPEVEILKPVAFAEDVAGRRRSNVAREVVKAGAIDHAAICEHLGQAFSEDRTIAILPRFSRLADAGMAAMDLVAEALRKSSQVALSDVAAGAAAGEVCEELMAAAQTWRASAEMQVRHIETAHRFAVAITSARPMECLRALLEHHEIYGGGLRWFVLRNGKLEPRTPPGGGSSRYRFRLWSLCRLGVQCGVLRGMPAALLDDEADEDELLEDADE
jgi:hypothetical protein